MQALANFVIRNSACCAPLGVLARPSGSCLHNRRHRHCFLRGSQVAAALCSTTASQTLSIGLQMLDKLLDRTHMLHGKPAPYKDVDVGFEVVHHGDGSGILASVNK